MATSGQRVGTGRKAGTCKLSRSSGRECTFKFEPTLLESIFPVLDAIAWLDLPGIKEISQFADIDPRTTGKLIKNGLTIGIIGYVANDVYSVKFPYPFKGSLEQKQSVLKEALLRMPFMISLRQFLSLGNNIDEAVRRAATVVGVKNFQSAAFDPLLKWSKQLGLLDSPLSIESLVENAAAHKATRHEQAPSKIVAFLSHSSSDKPFVRQLAADLEQAGISVWLDEHQIAVGDSISDKINQGLADSDFFLIALSEASVASEWVKKELSSALLKEIDRKRAVVLPLMLSLCEIPNLIKDKKYADFSKSYEKGFADLVSAMKRAREKK